ncbi:hypothetical protein E2320_008066, partial [Naja naja]
KLLTLCPPSLACRSPGPAAPTHGRLGVRAIGGHMQPRDIRPLASQEHCHQSLPCAHMPASRPRRLLTMLQEKPGLFLHGWQRRNGPKRKKSQSVGLLSLSGRKSHSHLKRLPLSVEKAPSTLPPRFSVPLLHVQEEPHSCGDWLALQPREKVRRNWLGEKLGRQEENPPSQPAGAVCDPLPGTLMPAAIQSSASCSQSSSVTGVSSGAMWGGLKKALPSSPLGSSPVNSMCSQRTGREREKEGGRKGDERKREKKRKREKEKEGEREKEKERQSEGE